MQTQQHHKPKHHRKPPHHAAHPVHKAVIAVNTSNAAFLAAAIPAAQSSEATTGVPASITIAQACIESGWGKHHIGDANNYFGIQAPIIHGKRHLGNIATGFVMAGSHEYTKAGKLVAEEEAFRKYANMADSFRDHGEWIKGNSHYPGALAAYATSVDADAFAKALQAGGYAGFNNKVYADSLISMMKKHNLYQYNGVKGA